MKNLGLARVAAAITAMATTGLTLSGTAENIQVERDRLSRPKGNSRRVVTRTIDHGLPASINRWTGKPHEHKREIARRARQDMFRNGKAALARKA